MQLIQRSATEWAKLLDRMSDVARCAQSVEHLNVADRDVLVPASLQLLHQWPESFVSFCKSVGISRAHFNGASSLQPTWMNDVVDSHLARQNRFVSRETIRTAIDRHEQEYGIRPTVTALRTMLKWQGDKGLQDFFPPKRGQSTSEEWWAFIAACDQALERSHAESLRSRFAVLHDLAAVVVALLTAAGMRVSTEQNREEMIQSLRKGRHEWILSGTRLANMVDSILEDFASISRRSCRVFAEERQTVRQTTKRLRSLTAQIPSDLDRSVDVFVRSAWKDGLDEAILPVAAQDN